MSTAAVDALSSQHESEAHAQPAVQPGPLTQERLGAFSAVPGAALGEGLSQPVMRHPRNGSARALIMRRAQQQVGNRSTQRLVAQLSRRTTVQRDCACGGTCEKCQEQASVAPLDGQAQVLQAKSNGALTADTVTAKTVRPAESSGSPLDAQTRRSMEPLLNADFRAVTIHSDSSAARAANAIQANAYAVGSDIYFAEGQYQPESAAGRKLLAHELTHVQQQTSGQQPQQAFASPAGDVAIGAPDDPLEHQAERNAELAASPAAAPQLNPVSGRIPETERVQRDDRPESQSGESVEAFQSRVFDRAVARLERNVGALAEWGTYIRGMQAFQLHAQLMSGNIFEYVQTASNLLGGGEKFELWAGTHDPGNRSYLESQLAPDADYRERANGYIDMVTSRALGYFTTPSVAERLQTFDQEKTAQPQTPQIWVAPDPRYQHYRDALEDIRVNKRGGCQKCHDILHAEQQTIDEFGTKLPVPVDFEDMRSLATQQFGTLPAFAGMSPMSAQDLSKWLDPSSEAIAAESQKRRSAPPPPSAPAPPAQPNPYIPDLPLPANVEAPIPRSSLCGALPPAAAAPSDYLAEANTWGPNSAVAAAFIRRTGSVLQPLGPRGYRVLPRETFDQLWRAGPDDMTQVRDAILKNVNDRQKDYRKLQANIRSGDVPYDELCPIVDELLPTTNESVRAVVRFDIAMKRTEEAILDKIMLIVGAALLLLAILFPPAILLSAPVLAAEAGMTLAGLAVGARDYRRGSQYGLGRGAGVYSPSQEAEADSLRLWGIVNIVTSIIGLFQLRASLAARELRTAEAAAEIHPTGADIEGGAKPVPGKNEPAAPADVIPDPDTTAKPGDFTPEQTAAADRKLAENIKNPNKVREVADPQLKDKYDLEVDLEDGQVYRRRKRDGTWCLFRNPTKCKVTQSPEVNQAADAQKAKLEAEAAAKAPGAVPPATVDPAVRLSRLRKGYAEILGEDAELQAKANLLDRHPNLTAAQRGKLLDELEDDLIDEAVKRLENKWGTIADEKKLRDYLRQHPEKVPDLLDGKMGWDQPQLPDLENQPPRIEPVTGGSGPVEAGLRGEEHSLRRSRSLGETFLERQLEFQVQTPQGPVNTIADLGVRSPAGEPQLIESKFGPNAGYTDNQIRANPLLTNQGGVPVNRAAVRFVQDFHPNWQPGQAVVVHVRAEFWSTSGILVRLDPF